MKKIEKIISIYLLNLKKLLYLGKEILKEENADIQFQTSPKNDIDKETLVKILDLFHKRSFKKQNRQ